MPVKVTYHIRQKGHPAPLVTTLDRTYAYLKLASRQQHAPRSAAASPLFYITHDVEPVEPLTNSERYLFLVFDVRQLQRRYFGNGRQQADLDAALVKEVQLDQWNRKTRAFVDAHPGFTTTLKAASDRAVYFAFFQIVEQWRTHWRQYFAYKKRKDQDPAVLRQMRIQCFDFEKTIDSYITKALKL